MNILIVFDSMYGNTQNVASQMGKLLAKKYNVNVVHVDKVGDLYKGVDWLVVGTPVHGGRATETISRFLAGVNPSDVKKVAVFDTRMAGEDVGRGLRLLIRLIGYAADKMQKALEVRGFDVGGAAGFIVNGKEGPLKKGELERAEKWIDNLIGKG